MDVVDPDWMDFLRKIDAGERPGLADRRADKVRQGCRRAGLAVIVPKPRRWQITSAGRAVLDTALRDREAEKGGA